MNDRSVLVTGAGGFLGGWVTEALHLQGYPVRAGVRRWGSGARVGRFPIEVVMCDVLDPAGLREAMNGVAVVVHCAAGAGDVLGRGTQNVLDAARASGVERVVHISSVAVYGPAEGRVAEDADFSDDGDPYARGKIEAERAAMATTGLDVTILRPTIIYGPHSKSWTLRYAQRLSAGQWGTLGKAAEGTCNAVYVGDVVQAIVAAIQRGPKGVAAYNVNGPEAPSWNEYFSLMSGAMGISPVPSVDARRLQLRTNLMQPVRAAAKLAMDRFGPAITKVYARQGSAKTVMRVAEGSLKSAPTANELRLYRKRALYPIDKARAELGFEPRTSLRQGLEWSAEWFRAMAH